jgi:hypothetical protein
MLIDSLFAAEPCAPNSPTASGEEAADLIACTFGIETAYGGAGVEQAVKPRAATEMTRSRIFFVNINLPT